MIDITQIIVALIGLLATVLTVLAAPWIKAKAGAAQWARLEKIVTVAVGAAEQLAGTEAGKKLISEAGSKLKYATARVEKELAKWGLRYDADTVRDTIEAAVREI